MKPGRKEGDPKKADGLFPTVPFDFFRIFLDFSISVLYNKVY